MVQFKSIIDFIILIMLNHQIINYLFNMYVIVANMYGINGVVEIYLYLLHMLILIVKLIYDVPKLMILVEKEWFLMILLYDIENKWALKCTLIVSDHYYIFYNLLYNGIHPQFYYNNYIDHYYLMYNTYHCNLQIVNVHY